MGMDVISLEPDCAWDRYQFYHLVAVSIGLSFIEPNFSWVLQFSNVNEANEVTILRLLPELKDLIFFNI